MRLLFLIGFLFIYQFIFSGPVLGSISLSITNLEKHDDYYSVDATITGMASTSGCFVQGMFTVPDDNHYFGQTWTTKGNWQIYLSSPEKDFVINNFVELFNDKSEKIIVKPDFADTDYKGSGNYLLKLKRYTKTGTASNDYSNPITVALSGETPTPTPTPTPSPTPTSSPTATSSPTPTKTPTPSPKSTATPKPTVSSPPSPKQVIAAPKVGEAPITVGEGVSGGEREGVIATAESALSTESSTAAVLSDEITSLPPEKTDRVTTFAAIATFSAFALLVFRGVRTMVRTKEA